MASGADRARKSRILAKGADATTAELSWLADFTRAQKSPAPAAAAPPAPRRGEGEVEKEVSVPAPEVTIQELPAMPVEDDILDPDEILASAEPDKVIFYDEDPPEKPSDQPPAKLSGFIATSTASSAFLMTKTAWSIFGDRQHVEPTSEEHELLTKVIGSYAERYGWTREMDDALLLGTVILAYNARCYRAPKKVS